MKCSLQLLGKTQLIFLFSLVFLLFLSTIISAQVSGTVFRDLPVNGAVPNTYGVKDANELGIEGVTVTIYPGAMATTTLADGTWGPIGGAGNVRVEFSNWPSYLEESADGGGNSSVQFSTTGGTVNFGLHNPADFSQSTPPLVIVHQINGLSSAGGLNNTLVSFGYTASGNSPATTIESDKGQVGAIWGLAYSKTRQELFSSAFLKSHSGLAMGGLGAIYSTDISAATNGALFVTIPNAGTINEAARGLGNVSSLSQDTEAFAKIGKAGLGDIDISGDEQFLYVVNLNDKNLYVIDIDAQNIIGNYPIPDPACANGDFRPFAVTYKDGVVYVGGICDAFTGARSDLRAYIYTFDPIALAFNPISILDFPLDYTRGGPVWGHGATGAAGQTAAQHTDKWYPWVDVYTKPNFNTINFGGDPRDLPSHSQPILSDIEFTANGSMVLVFSDRSGHQFGESNYLPNANTLAAAIAGGDILKATNIAGNWIIEPHVAAAGTEFFWRR